MSVFDNMIQRGHEQVTFFSDPNSGLKGIVAIHNTTLGPALGGCRMWNYKTEEEAKEAFILDFQSHPDGGDPFSPLPPYINKYHFEAGITYQKINNVVGYLGLNLTSVDFFNGLIDGGSINTQKYTGMSFGILLIPYQTKQYSGITCQLGYSHSFGFGGGFDLGALEPK